MARGDRVQLNLSIERDVNESLRALCEKHGVSLAGAISNFVRECEATGELIGTSTGTIPSSSTDHEWIKSLVVDQVNEMLGAEPEKKPVLMS